MAKIRNLVDDAANKLKTTSTQPATTTTNSTLLNGGRGASQAASLQAGNARVLQQNNSLGTNPVANLLNSNGLGSIANANRDVTDRSRFDAYKGSVPTDDTPTYDINGGNGGGGGVDAVRQVTDPYATIYALYENSINAQRDALNQQRQARLNALQANYNNAKSKLDSSYASGETELNQNADEALRQAYISNMLNQRNMAQYLAGQGITGGAAESILANLYNTYGNNRNDIERGRMDNLRQLLANYQGTLGDIENSYLSGMADADSDYSGAIANALTNYYGNLADLQKQNIANQYKAALGKSGSSSNNSTDSELVKTVKQFKNNPAYALQILEDNGYSGDAANAILTQAGIVPSEAIKARTLSGVSQNVRERVLDDIDSVYQAAMSNNNPYIDNIINNRMQQLQRQYGLTDEQARALLAELGL